ncbi:glycosyltransferase family 4 protein [Tenacibaculum ovolyticum]|uniref:glycosyltransferase family 4 protein n=1 Tax=Tenacibaculum ovolyticum TaxID=104270 RepID=UPI00049018DA|nr:glycosyltransferase family 4 protein [Tenacibaculum ovolyticum]
MKFLLITQNYPPNKGGMATSCDRLVRNFRKNDIEVHIIHFTNREKKFNTKANVGGTYTSLPIEKSEEFTLSLASEFILQLSFLNEITHILAFGGNLPMNLAPILSKWTTISLITFIRGNDFDEGIFSKKRNVLLFALKNSDFIFTVTSEKRDKIARLVNHNKTFFTPNSIDTTLWKTSISHKRSIRAMKELFKGKKTIGIVGQLKIKKGILNFCKTFAKFPHKDEYVICMIGDVDEEAKKIIHSLNINVQFFPFANQQDLLIFYNIFSIVAIPSFYDGMPNVLLEAAVTKNLVIGADVGGIKDVIEHEKDGFLYNPLKANTLLDVLLKIHKIDADEIEEIKKTLFKKISTNYTEENEINNYLKILS